MCSTLSNTITLMIFKLEGKIKHNFELIFKHLLRILKFIHDYLVAKTTVLNNFYRHFRIT